MTDAEFHQETELYLRKLPKRHDNAPPKLLWLDACKPELGV